MRGCWGRKHWLQQNRVLPFHSLPESPFPGPLALLLLPKEASFSHAGQSQWGKVPM